MSDRHLLRVVWVCGVGVILCIAALIFSGCASSHLGRGLNVAVGVSASADLWTTRAAITSGAGVEANPLMGSSSVQQVLVKAGSVGGVIGLADRLEKQGHPVLAHVIRVAVISVWSGVAWKNHEVIR